jgi:hypothetical protein
VTKKSDQDKNFRSLQRQADLSAMFGNQQIFNPYIYYYKLYNIFPHRHWYKDIDKTKLINRLGEMYDLNESAVFETHIHSAKKNNASPGVSAYILSDELMLCFPPWEFGNSNDVQVYYSDAVDKNRLKKLLDTVEDCYMKKEAEKREVHLLMQNGDNRLDFIPMHIQNLPSIKPQLCYNDDLLALNEMLIERLNRQNDKGLVIFYGKPGTGKTTYLRYLLSNISKQKLFIPASLNNKIGSAEFINLLNDFKNSVLIMEDADSILKKRSNDDDHIISNLLNLSDGMLSDFFHIQIISIFNKDINQVDPAMLRKGRLIASYSFRELTLEKTRALCQSLGYKTVPEHEMILADIFYLEQGNFGPATKSQIGF